MTDRNRKLAPDLVRKGWYVYSERSGACRRAELPGRSEKLEEVCEVDLYRQSSSS